MAQIIKSLAGRFTLALVIIIPSFILIFIVLFWPPSHQVIRFQNGTEIATPVPSFAERVDALKILLGVLGVWVGAIVAFYFGSESLERASQATKQTIELLSPTERLRKKVAKDHMLTPPYFRTPEDTIGDTKQFLIKNPSNYRFDYILIADPQKKPLGVLHDYEIDAYIIKRLNDGAKHEDVSKEKILSVMLDTKQWKDAEDVRDNFVKFPPETPLSIIKDMLMKRGLRVAYVTDVTNNVEVVVGVVSLRTILDAALV